MREGGDLLVTNLSNADLSNADLSTSLLYSTDLQRANLTDTDLGNAQLKSANLRGAEGWTYEQLIATEFLEGVTMPDGQIVRGPDGQILIIADGPTFEEWFTGIEGRREDEENE